MNSTYPGKESNVLDPGIEDKIEVWAGEEALKLLSDKNFQAAWDALYQSCYWATVFQGTTYVNTWYEMYKKQYIPILITSFRGDRLTGILNLCMNLQELEIVGTGGTDAYYHTWVTEEYNKESFIKSALKEVRIHFPGYDINLFQLPPHTPLNWLETDKYWKESARLKSYDRPLVDLTHPDLSKLFTKKQFKENRNRLKRLGEVSFEQVIHTDQLSAIFDEIIDQYDFRKGATLNILPFRSDPQKKDFLLKLFQLGMLHVAVLKLNDKIVAALIATVGKDKWVHGVGVNTHAPDYAAYSPGFNSFIMLAQQLATAEYKWFDLSTGDQPYKYRMANAHDQVYALYIKKGAKSIFRLPESTKSLLQNNMAKVGIDYKMSRTRIRRKQKLMTEKWQLLRQFGPAASFRIALEEVLQKPKLEIHKININKGKFLSLDTYIGISLNSLKDLLTYKAGEDLKTRWEFLVEAMQRLEFGEQVYTCSEEGSLRACVWLSDHSKKRSPYAPQLEYPTDGVVLQGLYFQPDFRHKLPLFLNAVCAKVEQNHPERLLYLVASPTAAASCGLDSAQTVP